MLARIFDDHNTGLAYFYMRHDVNAQKKRDNWRSIPSTPLITCLLTTEKAMAALTCMQWHGP